MFESGNNEETQKLLDLLCAMHDDVIITDHTGTVIMASPSTKQMYDIYPEEIVGKTVYQMAEEGILNPPLTPIALKTGKRISGLQRSKNGQRVVGTVVPIKNENGEVTHVVGFSNNIPEMLQMYEQYEALAAEVRRYESEVNEFPKVSIHFDEMIGESKALKQVKRTLQSVCEYDVSVLFTGESGTGKTKLASMLHGNSKRKDGPFIEIACGAIPENLLEFELFGYEGGAFVGANKRGKVGLIELARGGTLFLDGVEELPLNIQVKLLKVIQDKTIIRVGGTRRLPINFRLLSATNRNLEEMVSKGKFRDDLYYRLSVITIQIPPLRERKEDIIALANHFVAHYNEKYEMKKALSSSFINALIQYDWPGNIRELENLIERVILTSNENLVDESTLPTNIRISRLPFEPIGSLETVLSNLEREMVVAAYKQYGTTVGVAEALHISQPTAVRKIKKYIKT